MDSNTNVTSSDHSGPDQILSADLFDLGRINTKYLSNEARVEIGKTLLDIQKILINDAVSKEGDTRSVRNNSIDTFYYYVQCEMGLKPATTRSYMTIAKRFSKRPDVIRLLRWRDIAILVSYDDASVDVAIDQRLENPKMTIAEFDKSLALLRSRAPK